MILMYAENITPRLQYIVNFIGDQLFDGNVELTSDVGHYLNADLFKINYSSSEHLNTEFYLQNVSLLFERGVRAKHLFCFQFLSASLPTTTLVYPQ